MDIRKMPTEKEMMEQLRNGQISLPPLTFRLLEGEPNGDAKLGFDAFVEANWRNIVDRFVVECKSISTPKAFQSMLSLFKAVSLPKGYYPMVFMPYLNDQQLNELEGEGISGIDLCGNGVVVAPGKFYVYRSGEKNRFSSSAPIKNIYRWNSSMVGRVFLARPDYATVQEIRSGINRRNMLVKLWNKKAMSLSTVSKSLKTLEDDLIIERNDLIRLLQPDKLLEKLRENYIPPKIKERVRLKIPQKQSIIELLVNQSQKLNLPIVATGLSSVTQFAVMQREDLLSVYCPRLGDLPERLNGSRSDRFPDLEIIETEDETVFFDAWVAEGFWWASPSQVYFELMAGDKRDQETADQVKSYILSSLRRVKQ